MRREAKKNFLEDPRNLTKVQWVMRSLKLPWQEIFGRILKLSRSTFINLFIFYKIQHSIKIHNRSILLVILTERLGDIIAAHVAIANMVKPNQDIYWLVRPQFTDILEFNPHIRKIIPVSCYTETIILRKIFKYLPWKNLQIDGFLCNTFAIAVNNKSHLEIGIKNYYDYGPLSDVYSLISNGNTFAKYPEIFKDRNFDTKEFLSRKFLNPTKPLLIIHPVSDEIARSWSTTKCCELISWILANTNFNIIELGLTPVLLNNVRICLIGRTLKLSQQAALMSEASIFIGVDSGFAHLANACAIPSLLLIGKYHQFVQHLPWKTRKQDVVLRAAGQTNTLTLDEVKIAFIQMIEKLPLTP